MFSGSLKGRNMKKIGLFGGTFNPIHNGHLHIAEKFVEQCALDCVIFLPAGNPYHKNTDLLASEHRLQMVELAIAPYPKFAVSDCDMVREGATYTIDTVSIFKQYYPSAQLYWLLGMDSLLNLHTWKNWQILVRQVKMVVANREGGSLAKAPRELQAWLGKAMQSGDLILLNAENVDISSSQIRTDVNAGKNVINRLPENVNNYIQKYDLYQ